MKFVLLFVLCCVLWECHSSPVQIVENHELSSRIKAVGRQGGSAGAAPAQVADDDDDDDDEDEIDDVLGGDDDDDDDEDESPVAAAAGEDDDEDDEGDYIERIFDDILDDDDEDDDDDVSPSTGVQPAAHPAATPVQAPAVEQAAAAAINEAEAGGGLNVDYPNEGEQTVFYDEENGGIDTKVDIVSLNQPQEQVAAVNVQKVTATQAQQTTNEITPNASDDDDDDDEEDEIAGALDDDDDDDDDEEDDLIGDDVIEAKRARSFEKENSIPEVLTSRYNRFVDGIFDRINKILKQSYDPVQVRLSTNGKQANTKTNSGNKRKPQKKGRRNPKAAAQDNETIPKQSENQVPNEEFPSIAEAIKSGIPEKFITSSGSQVRSTKPKKPAPAAAGQSGKVVKNNLKKSVDDKSPKAQGTLYGLASLKRVGNVKVTPDGNNSTIKSKFTLGPLTLKVEKSFKRGTIRNVKSATARTNEMIGRINLRVVDGAATLVSIKVQQPKQVQVESSDNHDRTREFVWKRTPHIAHLVSEKLKSAAESLLQPVGVEVVRQ